MRFYRINPHLKFNFLGLKKFDDFPLDPREDVLYQIKDHYYLYFEFDNKWRLLDDIHFPLSKINIPESLDSQIKDDLLFELAYKDCSKISDVIIDDEEINPEHLQNFYDLLGFTEKTNINLYVHNQTNSSKLWEIPYQNSSYLEDIIIAFYDNNHQQIIGSYGISENIINCHFLSKCKGKALIFFIYNADVIWNYVIAEKPYVKNHPLGTIINKKPFIKENYEKISSNGIILPFKEIKKFLDSYRIATEPYFDISNSVFKAYPRLYSSEFSSEVVVSLINSNGTPTASTSASSHLATAAFDKNPSTYWNANTVPGPHWIQYKFADDNQYIIDHFKIISQCGRVLSNEIVEFYGSNDDVNWEIIYDTTFYNYNRTEDGVTINLTELSKPYNCFRWRFPHPETTYGLYIYELELHGFLWNKTVEDYMIWLPEINSSVMASQDEEWYIKIRN